MTAPAERQKVRFTSGDAQCAAWHYPGAPGTDRFARRFHEAGFSVLAFDYRRLGESGGQPRQVIRLRDQLADWQAAIGYARTRPEVDPARIAIWSFSLSGGHVFPVAARNPDLAAAIAQTPNADGLAATRNAVRHQRTSAMLRFTGRAAPDAVGALAFLTEHLEQHLAEPAPARSETAAAGGRS